MRTPNAFVRRHSILVLHGTVLTLRVSDFTLTCIGVSVVYLNIIERSSQRSTTGELLADEVARAF